MSRKKIPIAPPGPTCIEVAVPVPAQKSFTYSVPEPLTLQARIGKRVLVPFGRRRLTGYILGLGAEPGRYTIKAILDILDDTPLFPEEMVPFFRWMADYYLYPIGLVIRCALPGGIHQKEIRTIEITPAGEAALSGEGRLSPVQKEILRAINPVCSLKDLRKNLGKSVPMAAIRTLESAGWAQERREMAKERTRPLTERMAHIRSENLPAEGLSKIKRNIIDHLDAQGPLSIRSLKAEFPTAPNHIRDLEKRGYVKIVQERIFRDPFGTAVAPDSPLPPTPDQEAALKTLIPAAENGFMTFLMTGVTGSGKTEVYMQLAHAVIRKGKKVLVLVPEIALISQMAGRFRARFRDRVAVLHSGLSGGERLDQWTRILQGSADIGIGARSALFAPFTDPGLIIVDEEHDPSYKQESDLLYHARDMAVVRAKLAGCMVLLGSATPSVESYANAARGRYIEIALPRRIESRPLPEITVLDLKKNKGQIGPHRLITPRLQQAMKETLDRGQQALLFLNRRGYATFPVCASCGQSIICGNCDITLTYHQQEKIYRCHYCGSGRPLNTPCTICGSSSVKLLGFGTEKVEEAVGKLFPEARTARMDRDTTRRKGALLGMLKELQERKIDVLVGTQMVAKGHDFPGITLVGIICADLSLSFPDFRAGERTFQTLAQVAGRAGRGEFPGQVILQTWLPDHFSIITAKQQDFRAFYHREIVSRGELGYPPFSRLAQIKVKSADRNRAQQTAQGLGDLLRGLQKQEKFSMVPIVVLGPVEASIPRISGDYRWHLLLKSPESRALRGLIEDARTQTPKLFNTPKVKVVIDVDPVFMY